MWNTIRKRREKRMVERQPKRPMPNFTMGEEVLVFELAKKDGNCLIKLQAKGSGSATILHQISTHI